MLKPTIYGYASADDIDDAIATRVNAISPNRHKGDMAGLLGQAIAALSEINQCIPVESNERHLVAGALETFANGH